MSYSNETVHYGIPLPQQTDLVNGLDWNTSSEKVDGALYDATQIANTLKSDMEEVKEDIVDLKAEDTKIEKNATELTARVSTLEQNMQSDEEDIQDAFDMITDKEVTQAQSDVHVDEKEWFRYNGVLYVATKEINIGDTIVPNENCRATNIEDEMSDGGTPFDPTEINQKIEGTQQMIASAEVVGDTFTTDMSKGQYFRHNNDLCLVNVDVTEGTALEENVNYSVVDMTSGVVGNLANLNWSATPSTVSSALESLGDIAELSTEAKNNIVSAINEIYEMAKKGGGGMPMLDYENPLHTFSTGNLTYTTTEDCYVQGVLATGYNTGNNILTISGTVVAKTARIDGNINTTIPEYIGIFKVEKGHTITVSYESVSLHVYREVQ